MDFRTAYDRFLAFAGDGPIAAFGRDEKVLEENLRLYGIKDAKPLPLFYDLRGWFAVQGMDPRGRHSCEIGPALGVPFAGRSHNALDDARSLAAGMEVIAARGAWLKRLRQCHSPAAMIGRSRQADRTAGSQAASGRRPFPRDIFG